MRTVPHPCVVAAIDPQTDAGRRRARRLGVTAFLTIVLISAYSMALWLETAGSQSGMMGCVPDPGVVFRLRVTGALTAGACLLWVMSDAVSCTRIVSGPLFFFGLSAVWWEIGQLAWFGRDPALFSPLMVESAPRDIAMVFVPQGLALGIVLGAIIRYRLTWPLRVYRGLRLQSGFDAVFIPWLGLVPGLFTPISTPFASSLSRLSPVAISLGIALGFAFWCRRSSTAKRSWALSLGLVVALPTAAAWVAIVSLLLQGNLTYLMPDRWLWPQSYHGVFDINCARCDSSDTSHDAVAIETRLEAMGVRAEVSPRGPHSLRLALEGGGDIAGLLARHVLRPRRLDFQIVAVDQSALLSAYHGGNYPDLVLETDSYGDPPQEWVKGPSAESFARLLPAVSLSSTELVAIGCDLQNPRGLDPRPNRCTARILDATQTVSGHRITDAYVGSDSDDSSRAVVYAELDRLGTDQFATVTGNNVGHLFAIVLDGEILSAPLINEPIAGGRVQITLGSYESYERQRQEAHSLVASLRSGSLKGEWVIESQSVAGE